MGRLSTEVGIPDKPFVDFKPIIEAENYGRGSKLKILGIDVSRGVKRVDYKGRKSLAERNKTRILVEIEVDALLETLANVSEEQIAEAKKRLEPYLKCRKAKSPAAE